MGWSVFVAISILPADVTLVGARAVTSYPRMLLELSWNAMTELFGTPSGNVALTIWKSVWGFASPSMIIFPPKYQWRECSELDWPMSKHSTSEGLRPSFSCGFCMRDCFC